MLCVAEECALPGGVLGECVVLTACPKYVDLLHDRSTSELGHRYTQERRCGLEGINVKVCCPVSSRRVTRNRYIDKSDFVDELPQPGKCGRHNLDGPSDLDHTLHHLWYDDQPSGSVPYAARGFPVTGYEMAQWMALLAYRSPTDPNTWWWRCGGSIITKRHVLTAAHCVTDSLDVVRVGEIDLRETRKVYGPMDFFIKTAIRHEDYVPYHNDIAVLVVDGTIPIDDPYYSQYIGPVCLPEPNPPFYKQNLLIHFITGVGQIEVPASHRPGVLLPSWPDLLRVRLLGVACHRRLHQRHPLHALDPGKGHRESSTTQMVLMESHLTTTTTDI